MYISQEYFALCAQRDAVFPRAPVDDAEDMKLDQGLDEFLSLFIGPAEEKACECALAPAFRAEHVDEFGPGPPPLVRTAEKKRFEESLRARQVPPLGRKTWRALDCRILDSLHFLETIVTSAADWRLFFSQEMQQKFTAAGFQRGVA